MTEGVSEAMDRRGSLATTPGLGIIRIDGAGTLALAAVTGLGAIGENTATDLANLVVSAVLFLGGSLAFGVGFLRAAGRSRTEDVDIAGVVYLTGSAPRVVRRLMLGLWFAQILVATASVFVLHPPFGVMAPIWGVGLTTAWAARHGTFPPRVRGGRPARRSGPQ